MVRALVFLLVSGINVFLFGALYLAERITGRKRSGSGIIRYWAWIGLWCCGLKLEVEGKPMPHGGAIVANHSTWIDIFTLHAVADLVFVSKAEVGSWPFIGFLARLTDTVFIERRQNAAKEQQEILKQRVASGDRLCIFPEGTSTDGTLVLRFKSSLFGALQVQIPGSDIRVQPASVVYLPRRDLPRRFYGWWGDMGFGEHLLSVFAKSRCGRVRVVLHPPVRADDFATRKLLAAHCEKVVREGFDAVLAQEGLETDVSISSAPELR
ncbi:MAG: lysophospholipid acyltransferase family protein [Paracoccaceae bacterium]